MVCKATGKLADADGPTCYVSYHVDIVLSQNPISLSAEPDAAGIRWIEGPMPFLCVALRACAANVHLAMLIALAQNQGWLMSEAGNEVVFAVYGSSPVEAEAIFRRWGCAGTFTITDSAKFKEPQQADPPEAKPTPPPDFDPEHN